MAIINEGGYIFKTYQEYLDEMNNEMKKEIPNLQLLDTNPLIITNKSLSQKLSELDSLGLAVFNSRSVNTAIGYALELLGDVFGVRRNPATRATGYVTFTGNDGIGIPEGTQLQSISGMFYRTTEDVVITGGLATSSIIAEAYGQGSNTSVDTVTIISIPIPNVTSVTNEEEITGGENQETDVQLRERIKLYGRAIGKSTLKAIFKAVAEVPNVTSVRVYENATHTIDENGNEPHSIHVYVQGGDDEDVFEAIYDSRGAGIWCNGAIRGTTENGRYEQAFSRFDDIDIIFSVTLTVNSAWQSGFLEDMKNGIMANINTFNSNERVIDYSMFLNGIYAKPEYAIKTMSNDFSFTVKGVTYGLGDSVTIGYTEMPSINAENINITIVQG